MVVDTTVGKKESGCYDCEKSTLLLGGPGFLVTTMMDIVVSLLSL